MKVLNTHLLFDVSSSQLRATTAEHVMAVGVGAHEIIRVEVAPLDIQIIMFSRVIHLI